MENNNLMSTQTQNGGSEPTAKTFTQEEVNKMMSERVARVKAEKEQEYSGKLAELEARELKLQAREILRDKKLPDSLLDAVNCSDIETFNKSIEIIEKYINEVRNEPASFKGCSVGGSSYTPAGGMPIGGDLGIRQAMGLSASLIKK